MYFLDPEMESISVARKPFKNVVKTSMSENRG